MSKRLLFVGATVLSCFCSINADEVLTHVLEYDGTKINSRIDYTYDANGLLVEKLITKPNTSDPTVDGQLGKGELWL